MASYPPPPPQSPFGNDWKYQRQILKEQARAQRDMARMQREAFRQQLRGQRRSSILGPLFLITLGVLFLMVQTGHLDAHQLWLWYGRFWPLILIGAGVIMLLEWSYDRYFEPDPEHPRFRRRVGGGVFTLLILLGITGIIFSGVQQGGHSDLIKGWNLNQDNLDEFMGDKHESDQDISQSFPAGSSFTVNNPRGDISVAGTSDDNQIHVKVHKEVYTRSDSEADSKAQKLTPQFAVMGNVINLNVPSLEGGKADLIITLPPSAASTVTANHGDVHVSDVKAPVQVTANHGDIDFGAISGNVSIHINNSDNDVTAHNITGTLSIEGRGHDTTLTDLSGPVTINGDFFGSTHFERIRGAIRFHTSRTDLQLARLDGEADISSNSDLSVGQAMGPFILTTRNRNISLDRITGEVSITNRNGSVDLTSAPPLSNVTIENRNGSVNLTLPEQAGFAYQFDATNGSIDSEFSQIKGSDDDDHKNVINGTVGNGGPLLKITTSQGDVSLKKASIAPLPPLPPMPPKLTMTPPSPLLDKSTREAIRNAEEYSREATADAKEQAAEAREQAKEQAAQAREQAAEAREHAKEQAAEARERAKEAAQQAKQAAQPQ